MPSFKVHQCTNPACNLRIPIDPEVLRGAYCPSCGAPMSVVGSYGQYQYVEGRAGKPVFSALLDNIRSAYNVGAIFRTADGVGVEHLYLCGITPEPGDNASVGKTALGAEENVPWSAHRNAVQTAKDLQAEGYRLLGLECTPDAMPLDRYEISSEELGPPLLIVGNEQAGVDPGLIDLCDSVLSIPMYGRKASLNVATAFGVAAYWLAFSLSKNPK